MTPNNAQRILIIEDGPEIQLSLTAYLHDLGYATAKAGDGASGLTALRAISPAAVLLDLRMPEMDGLELLRIAAAEFPQIPIIIISGCNMMDDVVAALRWGAWDYLQKPIDDMALLGHALQRALERARLLEENRRHREHLELDIQERTSDLQAANQALYTKQLALAEVLNSIQAEKARVGRQVVANIQKLVLPQIHSLRPSASVEQHHVLDQMESALKDVLSPFVDQLSQGFNSLSPAELRVCNLIKNGMGVKEIAGIVSLSPETVSAHRRSIRRKLGLAHKKVNLSSFLQVVAAQSQLPQTNRPQQATIHSATPTRQ
jgi:DNA-binding NarL/FixJ family response regulator